MNLDQNNPLNAKDKIPKLSSIFPKIQIETEECVLKCLKTLFIVSSNLKDVMNHPHHESYSCLELKVQVTTIKVYLLILKIHFSQLLQQNLFLILPLEHRSSIYSNLSLMTRSASLKEPKQ